MSKPEFGPALPRSRSGPEPPHSRSGSGHDPQDLNGPGPDPHDLDPCLLLLTQDLDPGLTLRTWIWIRACYAPHFPIQACYAYPSGPGSVTAPQDLGPCQPLRTWVRAYPSGPGSVPTPQDLGPCLHTSVDNVVGVEVENAGTDVR